PRARAEQRTMRDLETLTPPSVFFSVVKNFLHKVHRQEVINKSFEAGERIASAFDQRENKVIVDAGCRR
ncbi:MAG TPA: hypothetical protein VFV51_12925, partial [Vicinamibacterales bacterium]|nr:hypothetical protein [Vicinamibacterales bacterium]